MKPKRLLFTLFVLYWVAVYGVTFFISNSYKKQLKGLIPTGYKMYAPITNTNFDIQYDFYKNNVLVDTLKFSRYIQKEYDKGIFWHKSSFAKSKLYEGSLKVLDFHYQTTHYQNRYNHKNLDWDSVVFNTPILQEIDLNLQNFAKLYGTEHPELKFDSVVITVYRYPMILTFNPEFRNDFTYEVGERIFYTTQIRLNP